MAEPISAAEACEHFLNSLEPERAREERPAVEQLVEWFGRERELQELTGEGCREVPGRVPRGLGGGDRARASALLSSRTARG